MSLPAIIFIGYIVAWTFCLILMRVGVGNVGCELAMLTDPRHGYWGNFAAIAFLILLPFVYIVMGIFFIIGDIPLVLSPISDEEESKKANHKTDAGMDAYLNHHFMDSCCMCGKDLRNEQSITTYRYSKLKKWHDTRQILANEGTYTLCISLECRISFLTRHLKEYKRILQEKQTKTANEDRKTEGSFDPDYPDCPGS